MQGKKATVYPGMEDKLTAAGAEYTGLPITLDGNIIKMCIRDSFQVIFSAR